MGEPSNLAVACVGGPFDGQLRVVRAQSELFWVVDDRLVANGSGLRRGDLPVGPTGIYELHRIAKARNGQTRLLKWHPFFPPSHEAADHA